MRVILMHNSRAGGEDHSADALLDEIRAAGHDVVAHVGHRKALEQAIDEPCDVVAIAGGDGTVGKAAKVLRGTGIPFAVVPCGTANNIARALGHDGVAWWDGGVARGYDVARVRAGDEQKRFIEAYGFGAFPRVIDQTADDPDHPDRLTRDRRLLRARIAAAPLERYRIDAGGDDLSGAYFLVEVLNIRSIGPRVALAPEASPGDGLLDVVVAGEAERAGLIAAIDALLAGDEPRISLPTRRAAHLSIEGALRRHHRDGDLRNRAIASVEITVEPAGLCALVPRAA